jgi:hypothetical protein
MQLRALGRSSRAFHRVLHLGHARISAAPLSAMAQRAIATGATARTTQTGGLVSRDISGDCIDFSVGQVPSAAAQRVREHRAAAPTPPASRAAQPGLAAAEPDRRGRSAQAAGPCRRQAHPPVSRRSLAAAARHLLPPATALDAARCPQRRPRAPPCRYGGRQGSAAFRQQLAGYLSQQYGHPVDGEHLQLTAGGCQRAASPSRRTQPTAAPSRPAPAPGHLQACPRGWTWRAGRCCSLGTPSWWSSPLTSLPRASLTAAGGGSRGSRGRGRGLELGLVQRKPSAGAALRRSCGPWPQAEHGWRPAPRRRLNVVGLPTDEHGMVTDELERLLEAGEVCPR